MPIDRRKFLSAAALMSGGVYLGGDTLSETQAFRALPIHPKPGFSLKILATNWGFDGDTEAFCAKAKAAGYDGVEVWFPRDPAGRTAFFEAVEKHDLAYGFLTGASESDFAQHLASFKAYTSEAVKYQPLFINCHSGKDYFSFEQGRRLIEFTTALSEQSGVPIYHETHRARLLFAAHIARPYLETFQELQLTLDISHWCNVHASLLQDQPENVRRALERTGHIHSRVGHPQGPQVTDPRAPEWEQAVEAHFQWWDQVVKQKAEAGEVLTMTTEFGPPDYMPVVPFTRQPLADLWDVNTHMMQLWRERYGR